MGGLGELRFEKGEYGRLIGGDVFGSIKDSVARGGSVCGCKKAGGKEMGKKKFRIGKALRKALLAAGAVGVGISAGVSGLAGTNSGTEIGVAVGLPVLVMAIRAAMNFWKVNREFSTKNIVR